MVHDARVEEGTSEWFHFLCTNFDRTNSFEKAGYEFQLCSVSHIL